MFESWFSVFKIVQRSIIVVQSLLIVVRSLFSWKGYTCCGSHWWGTGTGWGGKAVLPITEICISFVRHLGLYMSTQHLELNEPAFETLFLIAWPQHWYWGNTGEAACCFPVKMSGGDELGRGQMLYGVSVTADVLPGLLLGKWHLDVTL